MTHCEEIIIYYLIVTVPLLWNGLDDNIMHSSNSLPPNIIQPHPTSAYGARDEDEAGHRWYGNPAMGVVMAPYPEPMEVEKRNHTHEGENIIDILLL